MPKAPAGVAATSQESETPLPRGSLISEGFFRSWLVMLMGGSESAQILCRCLEQGQDPRGSSTSLTSRSRVAPDVAQHTYPPRAPWPK